MQIAFSTNPQFIVDFNEFVPKKEQEPKLTLNQRVLSGAKASFRYTRFFFNSLNEAAYKTFSTAGTSFKYIVLGYYGSLANFEPPADMYLAVFKIAFWILGMAWCLTTTTNRLFWQKANPSSSVTLNLFASSGINVNHIKTKELTLDASRVPNTIQVDQLLNIFNQINFTQVKKPGYMAASSRKEGSVTYTPEALKTSLEKFINNVKKRQAFLGTPPAYDIPRLMEFYQQIENAVRLSIHRMNEKMAAFKSTTGEDPARYNEEQKRAYSNLLEDEARIALDLAIAGQHCGARYMGEAMSIYYSFYGESSQSDQTLQECLIELLAHKRKEIAQRHIQRHLGIDTHQFNVYMANLGQMLGIPGTKNIVEHLVRTFDGNRFLNLFFQDYTVDFIIDAIQEKIKKSQLFREKITDWLKDQIKDWKPMTQEKPEAIIHKIKELMQQEDKVTSELSPELTKVQELISYLISNNVAFPSWDEGWDDFITELFALGESKAWLKVQYPPQAGVKVDINVARKIQALKTACSEEKIGLHGIQQFKQAITSKKTLALKVKSSETNKVDSIRRIIPLERDTVVRILKGECELEKAVQNYMDIDRRNKFIHELDLDQIASDGISPELMEWLLVSQEILLPQIA